MPMRDNREYRSMDIPKATGEYKVEGYASTFEPYVMFEEDGVKYYERIAKDAYIGCDMSDVIFQRDHEGTVMARTTNGTIELTVDDKGLFQRTDLSKTKSAKEMYEEIQEGMYTQMSFAFTVAEDHFEKETHTRVIDKIKKLYDVSAVSFPANPSTNIGVATRSAFDGFIEREKLELALSEKRARLKLLLEL